MIYPFYSSIRKKNRRWVLSVEKCTVNRNRMLLLMTFICTSFNFWTGNTERKGFLHVHVHKFDSQFFGWFCAWRDFPWGPSSFTHASWIQSVKIIAFSLYYQHWQHGPLFRISHIFIALHALAIYLWSFVFVRVYLLTKCSSKYSNACIKLWII